MVQQRKQSPMMAFACPYILLFSAPSPTMLSKPAFQMPCSSYTRSKNPSLAVHLPSFQDLARLLFLSFTNPGVCPFSSLLRPHNSAFSILAVKSS
jgi:hypothetical protein